MKKLTQRDILGLSISILVVLGGLTFLAIDFISNGIFSSYAIWIFVAIVILGMLGAFAVYIGKSKTDYYAMFLMGLIFIPFGILVNFSVFWVLGITYTAIGLVHRKEWKNSRLKKKK